MKSLFISFVSVCMCACASHNVSQPKTEPILSQPVSDISNDIDEGQRAAERLAAIDEAKYWKSLEDITTRVRDEALDLAICKEVETKEQCEKVRKQYCVIDELIDTHSGIHKKPYCNKE